MISIAEIHKIEKERRRIKKEIYTKIYEQFCKKIRNAVELTSKGVILRVPTFLMGYPTFDRLKSATYLKRQLENGGFKVDVLSHIDFYVTWNTPKSQTQTQTQEIEEDISLPSLINLKKLASKHRGTA
jgi:hypothetical protein